MELDAALRRAAPGARVSTTLADRDAYARDLWPRGLLEVASGRSPVDGPPAIVWPESTEHVVRLVELGRREHVALVPFGAGSGVCGGILPGSRTVVVDLKRLVGRTLAPGPELSVGAGALGITLEEDLLEQGFSIGHYPSSILCSTVGGWVAARGAGQCSGRYGKIEDMVTSVECVLGTGEVLTARRRLEGLDLTPLLIGSEGTLGIITRVGLRLHPRPTERAFAAFSFDGMEAGVRALRQVYQAGLRPAVARLYDPLDSALLSGTDSIEAREAPRTGLGDRLCAAALRSVLKMPRALASLVFAAERSVLRRASLVLVHEGNDARAVEKEAREVERLCLALDAAPLGEGPARAWFRHRYSVSYRQSRVFRAGAFSDTMEVAAPWSRLSAVYDTVRSALGRHVLVMAHLSHAYPDGASIYFTFAGTAHGGNDAITVYDQAWKDALSAALDAGATLSHHHGVGRSKAARLSEELGAALGVIRQIKGAWDPDSVLNPGALIPPPSPAEALAEPEPPTDPRLDRESLLAELPGTMPLSQADAWLAERGLRLPMESGSDQALSIDAWLAAGMPGRTDPYADPVLAPLAGFWAKLHDGRRIVLHPSPRRAVGPDLAALFVGASGSFGRVERACLTVVARETRSHLAPYTGARHPPVDPSERHAFERLLRAVGAGPGPRQS